MLLVQEFLKNHTFKELQEQYGVYAHFCQDKNKSYKFSLSYDQLEAKDSDLLSQQCRGIILFNSAKKLFAEQAIELNGKLNYDHICPGETLIMSRGMDRFFNLGQGAAANINFNDPETKIFEKIDGSCQFCYYDSIAMQWCIATRSAPEADIPLDNGMFTFRTLFEKALKETNGMSFNEFTDKLDKEVTYCFELTSPFNRIVVQYNDTRITFIAARTNMYSCSTEVSIDNNGNILPTNMLYSGDELDIKDVPCYGVPCVKEYAFNSVEDIAKWVSEQNPLEHEGVVARDRNFKRIKIKNPAYVAFSKAKDIFGSSERNCLELVLLEKEDDIIPTLPPEIIERILRLKYGVNCLIKEYDNILDNIIEKDRKSLALRLKADGIWMAPIFQMFDKKSKNMREFINSNKISLDKENKVIISWSNSFLDKILDMIKVYNVYRVVKEFPATQI